ncbi:MAG TPA: FAD-dependent monooxygenase [Trebonia sp.]|nr:FAD-dependent monooxygenase [Trebonia sp.]
MGGGPAGLYFSILMKLRNPGYEITVYERSQAGSMAGWGVTLDRGLLGRMQREDRDSAERLRAASYVWTQQVAQVRGAEVVEDGGDEFNISRRRMLDILASRAEKLGVRIEHDVKIANPSQLPDADLIVAADGVNSALRSAVDGFKTDTSLGANKYIWLGTDKVFDTFRFIFKETDHGWVWAHTYGIGADSSTFIVECSERTWAGLGFGTMSMSEALPVLEALFKEDLDGHQLIGKLGNSEARWVNFRTVSNKHWHSGNVVLIGDSARTVHFSVGLGTAFAIQDAICLADYVQAKPDLETAFTSYERKRKRQLVMRLLEAGYSRRWLENVNKHIDMKPQHFGTLLYARRSPLVARLPPRVSYVLLRGSRKFHIVNMARYLFAPAVKVFYLLPGVARPNDELGEDAQLAPGSQSLSSQSLSR